MTEVRFYAIYKEAAIKDITYCRTQHDFLCPVCVGISKLYGIRLYV
jgi:hypothetical protein